MSAKSKFGLDEAFIEILVELKNQNKLEKFKLKKHQEENLKSRKNSNKRIKRRKKCC